MKNRESTVFDEQLASGVPPAAAIRVCAWAKARYQRPSCLVNLGLFRIFFTVVSCYRGSWLCPSSTPPSSDFIGDVQVQRLQVSSMSIEADVLLTKAFQCRAHYFYEWFWGENGQNILSPRIRVKRRRGEERGERREERGEEITNETALPHWHLRLINLRLRSVSYWIAILVVKVPWNIARRSFIRLLISPVSSD